MRRVLILLTGGTLMMRPTGATARGSSALGLEDRTRDLVAALPMLTSIAEIETRELFAMDSGDMQPADWLRLARHVHAAISERTHDGIVIVHGTDTMSYTASALALLLGELPIPVVLTGAQRPLFEPRTDARENLIDAVLVATMDVPEVSVVFASRALRGVRSTKRDAWDYDAFDAPNCPPLVTLGVGATLAPHVRRAGELAPFDERIEERVLAVRVFPGLDAELVRAASGRGVKGLVLEAYGTGNLPRSLISALEHVHASGVPMMIVSQCLRGFVELGRYAGGAAAEAAGAISGGDMTAEAAIAKLMIGLGRYGPTDALKDYLLRDIIGERA